MQSRCMLTLKCNVTSKTVASDTFSCRLPRCERATLYGIPPSVWTMFLHVYELSLPKLVGGVMATGLSFSVGCRSRTVQYWHVPTSEFVNN